MGFETGFGSITPQAVQGMFLCSKPVENTQGNVIVPAWKITSQLNPKMIV